jgi:hypothetical protein
LFGIPISFIAVYGFSLLILSNVCIKSTNNFYKSISCSQNISGSFYTLDSWSVTDPPLLKPAWYSPIMLSEYISNLILFILV